MKSYVRRVLVAIDLLINAIIGGKKYETLSASAHLGETRGLILPTFFRPKIDWIFEKLGESDHCRQQYLYEQRVIHLEAETNEHQ